MPNKQVQSQQDEVRIISKSPSIAVDGTNIVFNNEQGYGDLTFLQTAQKVNHVIDAIGVASVRLNLAQFRSLRDILNQLVNEQEKKLTDEKEKTTSKR